MNIARRLFLKRGGIALASLGAGAIYGPEFIRAAALAADDSNASGKKKVLVCVFQRGAVDGMSMVVPHGDPFYYKHRQEIAIAQPSRAGAEGAALDLDGFFGLHPAMKPLLPLFEKKVLAVVQACGSPNESRSHFDMQDFMESGTAEDKSLRTGWINRMLLQRHEPGKPTPFRAVAMGSVLPRSLQGSIEALAMRDLDTFGIHAGGQGNVAAGFEGMYDSAVGDLMGGAGAESFEAMSMLKKADPAKYKPAHGADYPKNAFGHSLLQVAQLIKANVGLEVAFVEVGGWDTHASQGGAAGQLAGNLFDFAHTLAAFHKDLGNQMENVLLLTMSEFGRAARQNGNRGTDHGHGNCFFVLGGNVAGGKVHGNWPGLSPEKLFEDRDLAVTTDFRDVFAEACVRHMGLKPADLTNVFPKYASDAQRFAGICKA